MGDYFDNMNKRNERKFVWTVIIFVLFSLVAALDEILNLNLLPE